VSGAGRVALGASLRDAGGVQTAAEVLFPSRAGRAGSERERATGASRRRCMVTAAMAGACQRV
jgi:tRNA U34 5-methylaminomethyl-2-thiouridine-forming methyltransferase MnmC